MLIPVLGRAGSGKTTFVLERLLQAAKKGRVLLLVPELLRWKSRCTSF